MLLAAAGFRAAEAQGPPAAPLTATGQRDLTFGLILAGMPTAVSPTATTSGLYELRGARNREVQLVFTLPNALSLPTGEQLPLSFAAGDARASSNTNPNAGTAFDPNVPFVRTFPGNQVFYVFLGGTVQPAVTQRSGIYSGPITLTVAYTGN